MNLGMNLQLRGEFAMRKRDVSSGLITEEYAPFSNNITDIGLNRMGTGNIADYCYVGTGTTPPANTDANMSSYLTRSTIRSNMTRSAGVAPSWITSCSRVFTFPAGTISTNITEVGIGWGTLPANNLWSRELTKDSSGNPVSITVLPNEILEVVYTLYLPIPQTDREGSFTLNSIVYNYITRASLAGAWLLSFDAAMQGVEIRSCYGANMVLSPSIATRPTGTILGTGSRSNLPYVANSRERAAITSFGLSDVNSATGILGFALEQGLSGVGSFLVFEYQMILDKPIMKTNTNTMSITLKHSWSRGTPPVI